MKNVLFKALMLVLLMVFIGCNNNPTDSNLDNSFLIEKRFNVENNILYYQVVSNTSFVIEYTNELNQVIIKNIQKDKNVELTEKVIKVINPSSGFYLVSVVPEQNQSVLLNIAVYFNNELRGSGSGAGNISSINIGTTVENDFIHTIPD